MSAHEPTQQRPQIELIMRAVDIRNHHHNAQRHATTAIEHARAAGELLLKAKDKIEHGGWLPWLRDHARVTPRQAQRYMRLAENWQRIGDATRASHLTLRQALDAIASPKLTELQRAQDLEAEADEVRQELDALNRRLDSADSRSELTEIHDRAGELEAEAARLRATALREFERLMRELDEVNARRSKR